MSALDDSGIARILDVDATRIRRFILGSETPSLNAVERLRGLVPGSKSPVSPSFRFIDLFAGIGGMRYGFEAIGGKCVFSSERDRFSRISYLTNFPDPDGHKMNEDIREFEGREEDIPEFDVLLAGFPCQPFSLAGVSKKNALGRPHGFDCKDQGNLFFNIAGILRKHQPAAFLLENVKNLEGHDQGRTFRTIRSVLQGEHPDFPDIDYDIHFRVIDAKAWVPQHRERVFIVGFRKTHPSMRMDFDFGAVLSRAPSAGRMLSSILHENVKDAPDGKFVTDRGTPAPKYTLTDHLWNYLQNYAAKHKARGNGFGFGLVGPEDIARTLSARYHKDGSEILVRQSGGKNPRRLTPCECARLMGFSDDVTQWKVSPRISDTQLYRQFGNAVVVPVVRAVASEMAKYIPVIMASEEEEPLVVNG